MVFHINHPFWGIYPYFWKHPYIQKFSSHKHVFEVGLFLFAMTVPWNLRSTTGAEKAEKAETGSRPRTGPIRNGGASLGASCLGRIFREEHRKIPRKFSLSSLILF